MSARQDDERRIGEIWHTSRQLQRRLAESGLGRDAFLKPSSPMEEMAVDGILYSLYRILEEATNLSDGTKITFPHVPWDAIRGMRNRLAHDYPGTRFDVVWDTIDENLRVLQDMCETYCADRGLDIVTVAEPDAPRRGGR